MDRRAQGLPITTIIIAILGLVVLVILFAITTGRLAVFGRGVSECPGRCATVKTITAPIIGTLKIAKECDTATERTLVGNYVAAGQPSNTPADQLVKCDAGCCVPLI